MSKFYVTTAIPYVNAPPHIGFAMEAVQADVLARYHRLKGDTVYFLTGTDEHGAKLFQTAKDMGLKPQALADQNAGKFAELAKKLNLSNDQFIRTTDARHKSTAQKMWKAMAEKGDIYKGKYAGLYCVGCEAYVPEKDLIDGKCPNHKKEPVYLEEENYFFKLSRYSGQIRHAIESGELKIVPEIRKNEMLNIIGEEFPDVSFSRPRKALPWGIDVPDDPNQVMYVWCDALSNYISALDYEKNGELFQKFWPADVHLIGKDILRFHAGIWIGMLFSAGISLPKAIYVHGFITSEGQKMSKSLGNVVDPFMYIDEFGEDPLRYYLIREIPTADDGDFSRERFETLYEAELANNLGNLVQRVLVMTQKYFDSKVPEQGSQIHAFVEKVDQTWKVYHDSIEAFDLKKAIEAILAFVDYQNKFVEEMKPWELAKKDKKKLAQVLYHLLEGIRYIAVLFSPFLPQTSEKIAQQMGLSLAGLNFDAAQKWGYLETGVRLGKIAPLFPKREST